MIIDPTGGIVGQNNLKIHSITSLITNSSTTIYTNCTRSVEPAKQLLNEILRLAGETKTCDEVFEIFVSKDIDFERIWDCAYDYICDKHLEPWYNESDDDVYFDTFKQFFDSVMDNKIEKPEWFENLESDIEEDYDADTQLKISVKDPKYQPLADFVIKFINSPAHFESRS